MGKKSKAARRSIDRVKAKLSERPWTDSEKKSAERRILSMLGWDKTVMEIVMKLGVDRDSLLEFIRTKDYAVLKRDDEGVAWGRLLRKQGLGKVQVNQIFNKRTREPQQGRPLKVV